MAPPCVDFLRFPAQLHVAQPGNFDPVRVFFYVFTFMAGHPLPGTRCTQTPVQLFCFSAGALEKEALCASDKCIDVGEVDAESSTPPNLEALPRPTGQEERSESCELQADMWYVLKSSQVLVLQPPAMQLQVTQI